MTKSRTHKIALAADLAAGIVVGLGSAVIASAQPTADQVLSDMGFSASDKQNVMAGQFVTGEVTSVSDRDLSVSMAFLTKTSPDALSKQIMSDKLVANDPQVKSYGDFGTTASAADLAGLKISDSVAQSFQNAQAGESINLSTAEIAAFGAVQGGTPAVLQQLRAMLLARQQSYAASGLAGIAPYDRGGSSSDVAADLRKASAATKGLAKYMPAMHALVLGYPNAPVAGLTQKFRWTNMIAHDTPTIALTHILSAPEGDARVVVQRQFYVSTGYNGEQAVAALLPVQEGTIVAYTNHTFTDQVAGFGSSMKRSIGERLMVDQLQKVFAADRQQAAK